MTQTEIEAYDAMMADRDSWKERFLRLAKEKALCPSDATACSADVVNQLKQLADDWFARAVDEMGGAVKEKNARDGMNFYQHTARAAVLCDCRKQLMEIILPYD